MSIYAIVWAYDQRVENSGQKFTLVTAAQYSNDEGICWVKQETLAEDMNMSERAVRGHLAALEEAEIIKRHVRRRSDGTRSSDLIKLLGYRKRKNLPVDNRKKTTEQPEESAGLKRHKRETSSNEGSLRSPSADQPPSENGSKKKAKPPKPKNPVTKLMDRVIAARERGANPHPLPSKKRGEFGQFYHQAILDGHLPEHCDLALDFMVAKASGQVPEEPKAWCGFGTALDTVELEGWRPKGAQGGRAASEADKEWEREQAEMWQQMQEAKKERTDG